MKFSLEQRSVIETKEARVQVLAYAGTGKTTALCARIERVIKLGVKPEAILVLSFSNAACEILRANIGEIVPAENIQTFHAYGRRLIHNQYKSLGFEEKPTFIRDKRQVALLKSAIRGVRRGLPKRGAVGKKGFLQKMLTGNSRLELLRKLFGLAQASGKPLREWVAPQGSTFSEFAERPNLLKKVLNSYQKSKLNRSLLDYGDMVELGTKVVQKMDQLGYCHLLVDEYQDCTVEQAQFVSALADLIPNVMIFGDPCQAVFGFAAGRFTDMKTIVEGTVDYQLTESYRLTEKNAALATSLAGGDVIGHRPRIVGLNGPGAEPVLIKCKRHTASASSR